MPAECVSLRSDANGLGPGRGEEKAERWTAGVWGLQSRSEEKNLPLEKAEVVGGAERSCPKGWASTSPPAPEGHLPPTVLGRELGTSGTGCEDVGGLPVTRVAMSRTSSSARLQELLHVPNLCKPPKLSQTHF